MTTMKWEKAPEDVAAAFDAALPADPLVQRRKMFGYAAAFVNGNMFAGVWQSFVALRLPEARRAQLIEAGAAKPFVPMGRAMREYIVTSPRDLDDPAVLGRWLEDAFRFAASLPAKAAKPRSTKASGRSAHRLLR